MNCHFEVMVGKLAAVREGRIRRLLVNVPARHLKSHVASVSFPARCLVDALLQDTSAPVF
jgi:hypothetical protein